ncbi:MAG: hypothetical protein FJW30_15285 [Acidobacteria bacterium]|nr:hypothetical protein [Acidobacteriota bacterium]
MNTTFQFDEPIDLSRFNTLYRAEPSAEAPVHAAGIPDGRYEVVVAEAILTRSSNGNPMVRWLLRISGATFRDRIIRKHRAITDKTIGFVRKELEVCGLQLDNFSDLAHRVHEMEGVELEITKVTKGEDSNIYFNRAITSRTQPSGMTEDDLPF